MVGKIKAAVDARIDPNLMIVARTDAIAVEVLKRCTGEATLSDIKRAYRRLARRYHPNINPGDREAAEQFRRGRVESPE